MKKEHFEINYYETQDLSSLDPVEQRLINKARSASKKAYAPYSHFHVGAAVLLENGEIVTGSNQENAAYPSGICAERTALYYAGSLFPDVPVKTIAVAASFRGEFMSNPVSPCGACRQVILETQYRHDKPVRVIMFGDKLTRIVEDVNQLLPFPFDKIGDV